MKYTLPKGVAMARQLSAMSNAKQIEYQKWECVAGRDPWYQVIKYRVLLMCVDILSVSGVFAGVMTWLVIRFMDLLLKLATVKLASAAVIGYITFGIMLLAAFIFAWTYFAARKFTPPVVEALAERIAGKGKDITVTADLNEEIKTETVDVLYKQLTETPPEPIVPPGWPT
jgi:hypothetical protein